MAHQDPHRRKLQARMIEPAQINRRKSLVLNFSALALVVLGFLLHNWPL